jgi:hypothetical protein
MPFGGQSHDGYSGGGIGILDYTFNYPPNIVNSQLKIEILKKVYSN